VWQAPGGMSVAVILYGIRGGGVLEYGVAHDTRADGVPIPSRNVSIDLDIL